MPARVLSSKFGVGRQRAAMHMGGPRFAKTPFSCRPMEARHPAENPYRPLFPEKPAHSTREADHA